MKSRHSKLRSSLLVILTFFLVLTACSGGGNSATDTPKDQPAKAGEKQPDPAPTSTPEPEKKDPVTLKLHTWFVGPNQALFDKFHEMYPWITIEPITKINGGIIKNIVAGEESDLVFLDNGLVEWMSGDLLEDLKPYVEKDERIKNAATVPGFLEAFQTGGKQYTIPYSDIPMWVVVNKDLLKKSGQEMPSNDWTYDQFLEMAKKATNPSANEWGGIGLSGDLSQIMPIANGNAANYRLMNEDMTQSVANSPGVLADLKWVQELTTKWHIQPTQEEAKSLGFDQDGAFYKGNFLFMIGADWYLPGLKENAKFEWDVLPMPKGKVTQATVHQAGAIAIPKGSKHKEEAFMYISFLFSEEAQKTMIENGSGAFVRTPALDSYYDQVEMWKGKNVEAIKMNGNMPVFSRDPAITEFSYLMDGVLGRIQTKLAKGGDFNEIIPFVEKYNTNAAAARKALGW
ncbi:extracellular solute-binding protein [Paenibacillus sp. GCM10027629]|uniref:extracellular solute-binding protein n=1 Tax=Paenibacillus sp. GCM10027629 TaxID=3273414 RepID=UPI003629EA9E